jgi:cell division protease FtsH
VAALEAAREQAPALTQAHLLAALEAETLGKLLPGSSALQHLPGPVLRRLALQRAAGALAQELLPQLPGLELVSVAARESSLHGFVRARVDDARDASGIFTAAFMRERAAALLAPRAAEEAVYGLEHMSVAHEEAIAEARALCRRCVYVGAFASSAPALGRRALAYAGKDNDFLGAEAVASMPPHVSDATHAMADAEVAALMEDAYAMAARLIAAHRTELDAITEALMARATLTGDEVRALARLPAKTAPLEVAASASA